MWKKQMNALYPLRWQRKTIKPFNQYFSTLSIDKLWDSPEFLATVACVVQVNLFKQQLIKY